MNKELYVNGIHLNMRTILQTTSAKQRLVGLTVANEQSCVTCCFLLYQYIFLCVKDTMVCSGIRVPLAVRFLERTTAGRLCETRRLIEEVSLEENYVRGYGCLVSKGG